MNRALIHHRRGVAPARLKEIATSAAVRAAAQSLLEWWDVMPSIARAAATEAVAELDARFQKLREALQ